MILEMKNLPEHIIRSDFDLPTSSIDEDIRTGGTVSEQFIQTLMVNNSAKGCELLFRRYHKILCNHAIRFVYSKEIAEDIVSEVFCRLWKSKAYANISTSYRFYLMRSVRNEAYNYLKSEFHKTNRVELPDTIQSGDHLRPDQMAYMEEITGRIQRLIEGLPPQCRKIFLLSRYEGKKQHIIAEELAISVKTVEAHIGKALASLRSGLKDYWV